MKITFLGATFTVTGSKYLLEWDGKKVLVDCGLFQGIKELRLKNRRELPIKASDIDAVILTHAHIDHSGYLPLLVKQGFRGHIYATKATRDLCAILLPDSGYLQEEEARHANKYGYSKHAPALPLYTKDEAVESLKYFYPVEFGQDISLDQETTFQFNRVGHILGAASVLVKYNNKRKSILFSGDFGRKNDPILLPPEMVKGADYLVVESTYGDRRHEKTSTTKQLEEVINRTVARGGTIVIPAFAVGRSQLMMYYIHALKKARRIPDIPVFLDSPMAISASNIYHHYLSEHKVPPHQCHEVCNAAHYVETREESKSLDHRDDSIIIISASGMASGGRVLHHLKVFAPDPKNTILFAGYQAAGTRGRKMISGIDVVKIHGEMIPIRAEVGVLDNISAHADYTEILDWMAHFTKHPKKVFVTHGESESAKAMKKKIEKQFGCEAYVPKYRDSEEI